jgi:hypothetical protein
VRLLRAERGTFTGPPKFTADIGDYFADMVRPYANELRLDVAGHSYGEMAAELMSTLVNEPVDLLVLAFSIHDMWPGRATATYLSHRCPGTPLSFAICDQGSAAAFTGLRLINSYRPRRALLIVVEQAALPYDSPAGLPVENRGVAMLFGRGPGADVRQHPAVAPEAVAALASAEIAALSPDRVVLSNSLAEAWPGHPAYPVVPSGQPTTGIWWQLADEVADRVIIADYDPDLGYLCLAGLELSHEVAETVVGLG